MKHNTRKDRPLMQDHTSDNTRDCKFWSGLCLMCYLILMSTGAAAQATSTLTVRAWATLSANVGPQLEVRVNGILVASAEIRATSHENYTFPGLSIPAGAKLDLIFNNDSVTNDSDRNLFVESITVNGTTTASNAPGVTFDRGFGAEAFDNLDVLPGLSTLYWNGALRFILGAGSGGTTPDLPDTSPAGYVRCASEGETCNFTGASDVVYGALFSWTIPRSFNGGTACTNTVFGDPLRGTVKACYAKPTALTHLPLVLNVTIAGTGGVGFSDGSSCSTSCVKTFNSGSTITVVAAASTGYTFAGWGGACSGTGSCSVTMGAAKNVSATFAVNPATLIVSVNGSGTVGSSPSGINCGAICSVNFARGTAVTLSATPANGFTFSGWSGACTGSASCLVKLDTSASLGATFTPTTVERAPISFPGAIGPGSISKGAYTDTDVPNILYVTNLNDSGPGSLRAALENNSAAIIVPKVAGYVVLKSEINAAAKKTILGAMAPGPFGWTRARITPGSDTIWLATRGRAGDEDGGQNVSERDSFNLSQAGRTGYGRIMVAFNSWTHGPDETSGSFGEVSQFSVIYNIIGEGFVSRKHASNTHLSKTPPHVYPGDRHSTGGLYANANGTPNRPSSFLIAFNLFTTNRYRNPGIRGARQAVLANNFIYNYQNAGLESYEDNELDIFDNWFEAGPQTGSSAASRAIRLGSSGKYFVSGNHTPTGLDRVDQGADFVVGAVQFPKVFARMMPAEQTKAEVLARVGARLAGSLDVIDERIVYNAATGGPSSGPGSDPKGNVEFWKDYFGGTLPTYNVTSLVDTNEDGIIDAYEVAMGKAIGTLTPHTLINAPAQGLNARWQGHRQIMHQHHWRMTGSLL